MKTMEIYAIRGDSAIEPANKASLRHMGKLVRNSSSIDQKGFPGGESF